ncbi:GNAT family N-acetyltransferase [Christiangramia sp. ASW11-125]|uniref:GNAT family N-acetyltransferase n=1 Tax=Christiangramia sp. ASW11-125 TaxID=3400701 RepID=UPI003AAA6B86
MNIKEATKKDIPEIVSVLKASLGEKHLILSEDIWRFKHLDNPFGESITLLAVENNKIVGVRAFMKWQWAQSKKIYSALRAVDTATHPEHQGKGIFKKLTLAAVEVATNAGDNFIFNTPNDLSRPGYLKMGWQPVGKISVGVKPSFSFLKFKKIPDYYSIQKNVTTFEINCLCDKWNEILSMSNSYFTPKSAEFLSWRYENNPLQEYKVICEDSYYIAGYIKKRGNLKELRIAEFIFDEKMVTSKDLRRIISKFQKNLSTHLISFSPELLKLRGKKGNFGPLLVLNELNLSSHEKTDLIDISNWKNSIGDLELF